MASVLNLGSTYSENVLTNAFRVKKINSTYVLNMHLRSEKINIMISEVSIMFQKSLLQFCQQANIYMLRKNGRHDSRKKRLQGNCGVSEDLSRKVMNGKKK
jgi:hypothetical protein